MLQRHSLARTQLRILETTAVMTADHNGLNFLLDTCLDWDDNWSLSDCDCACGSSQMGVLSLQCPVTISRSSNRQPYTGRPQSISCCICSESLVGFMHWMKSKKGASFGTTHVRHC